MGSRCAERRLPSLAYDASIQGRRSSFQRLQELQNRPARRHTRHGACLSGPPECTRPPHGGLLAARRDAAADPGVGPSYRARSARCAEACVGGEPRAISIPAAAGLAGPRQPHAQPALTVTRSSEPLSPCRLLPLSCRRCATQLSHRAGAGACGGRHLSARLTLRPLRRPGAKRPRSSAHGVCAVPQPPAVAGSQQRRPVARGKRHTALGAHRRAAAGRACGRHAAGHRLSSRPMTQAARGWLRGHRPVRPTPLHTPPQLAGSRKL